MSGSIDKRQLVFVGAIVFSTACSSASGSDSSDTESVVDAATRDTFDPTPMDVASPEDVGDAVADMATEASPPVTAKEVCFFADSSYAGKTLCVGKGSGDLSLEWNDTISSVKVPSGLKLELFADAGSKGRALTLIADEARFSGCFFNDAASSYRVTDDTPSKLQSVNFLRKVSGCKIVSGQHNDEKGSSPHYYTDIVRSITGQEPALWSGDFGFSGNTAARWEVTNEAKVQWKKGAIINLMFHACPPTQGSSCGWDGGVKSKLSVDQWNDLLTDGGKLNKAWKARLDELVPFFQDLKTNKVEVLFRPLHEMNQSVFWWGGNVVTKGTARLFQITRDYLVVTKGFDNLGFVWNVQNLSKDYASYDPGEAYWDVSSIDYYGGGSADSTYGDTSYYDALMPLTHGKPIAIGESFFLPTPGVQQKHPQMSFFMIWAYGIRKDESGNPTNTDAQIMAAYADPRVVKLADMPGWK